jgi:hypothetical protein
MRGLKCGHALSLLGNTFSGMLMETDVLFMRATCVFFLWSTKFISPCHEFLPSLSQRLDQNLECSAGFMPQTHAILCCFSLCTGDAENICANCFGTKLMMIQQDSICSLSTLHHYKFTRSQEWMLVKDNALNWRSWQESSMSATYKSYSCRPGRCLWNRIIRRDCWKFETQPE